MFFDACTPLGSRSMINRILFATDLSPFSAHTLEHVTNLALHHRARVIVVHAVEPLGGLAQAVASKFESEAEIRALLRSIKERILESLTDELSESREALDCFDDVLVRQGRPAEIILKLAAELNGDLIVLGSHGPQSMGRNVLGSVTSRVLQLSKVPVYMVPMSTPIPPRSIAPAASFR